MGTCCIAQVAQLGVCGDLDGWDGGGVGGRSKREGIYVYLQLIHSVVQQKLTQRCKATIPQLKKRKKKRKNDLALVSYLQLPGCLQ